MANLTTNTTFFHSVQGNVRLMYCDISSAGQSTADLIVVPLSFVQGANFEGFRAAPGAGAIEPILNISGTTINFTNYTTGIPFTISVAGH